MKEFFSKLKRRFTEPINTPDEMKERKRFVWKCSFIVFPVTVILLAIISKLNSPILGFICTLFALAAVAASIYLIKCLITLKKTEQKINKAKPIEEPTPTVPITETPIAETDDFPSAEDLSVYNVKDVFLKVLAYYREREETAKSSFQKEALINEAIAHTDGGVLFRRLASTLTESIAMNGSDITKNKFLKLIAGMKDSSIFAQPDIYTKLSHISGLYKKSYITYIDDSFYKKPSLYFRSLDDFIYVANAYAIVSDKILASKYFSDVDILDPSKFLDSRGKVRPKKQIYELIDSWYTRAGIEFSQPDDDIGSGLTNNQPDDDIGSELTSNQSDGDIESKHTIIRSEPMNNSRKTNEFFYETKKRIDEREARHKALLRCQKCANYHACGSSIGTPKCGAFTPKDCYKNK